MKGENKRQVRRAKEKKEWSERNKMGKKQLRKEKERKRGEQRRRKERKQKK